jgi:putative protease
MAAKAAAGEVYRRGAELLAPAGDMERLMMALTFGADAVYLAGTRFGMRAGAGNFGDDGLKKAVTLCRSRGVKLYVACNTILRGDDTRALPAYLERLQELGADAVIVTDLGAFTLAKKYAPKLKLHVSTQAGIMNAESAGAFFDMGASRVILARELTLKEISEIRRSTPETLELEAFVHGSMCVAFSGRCLLSDYMAGRQANAGECAQPCRWKYYLTEAKRPGEMLEISEDGGTYIFNSRDLCMIDHLRPLLEAGITSFKIEGRTKSAYYAAAVTNAYRHALDAARLGAPPARVWSEEVYKVSHREYSTGFYFGKEGPGQYYRDSAYFTDCDIAAVVEECGDNKEAVLTMRNRFGTGDVLELLTPYREPLTFTAGELRDAEGLAIAEAVHPMMVVRMRLPETAPRYSILRKIRQTAHDFC